MPAHEEEQELPRHPVLRRIAVGVLGVVGGSAGFIGLGQLYALIGGT